MTLEDTNSTTVETVDASPEAGAGTDQTDSPADSPPDGAATKTAEARAQQKWQSIVDADREKMKRGQFDRMNPKTVELLTEYHGLLGRQSAGTPAASGSTRYQEEESPPSYEEIGRQAIAERKLNEIKQGLEEEIRAEEWAADVKEFFAAMQGVPLTDDDWAAVDFLDAGRFPRTAAGYRAWKNAMIHVSRKYGGVPATIEKPAIEGDDAPAQAVKAAADKAKAASTRRPPNPVLSKTGIKDLGDAARRLRKGELSREEYREVLTASRS